ncbi:hypothetical protein IJ21_01500 [Paenibacillus sp. 32O-W]|nr:hypothetical protein IJ21_01500 [Paenibacillus sp. 32O-W]
MEQFIRLIQHSVNLGVRRYLRVDEDFIYYDIGPNYKIIQWLNDKNVDMDMRRYFKSVITRKPYIDSHREADIYSQFKSSDFFYNTIVCKGLGIAHLIDGIAISFQSDDEWNKHTITLRFVELDNTGDIYEEDIETRHISNKFHLDLHKTYLDQKRKIDLNNNTEWRNELEQLFPSLIFCDRAKAQLFEYKKGDLILKQIQKRLFELNEYFTSWQEGAFNNESLPSKVTPESPITLVTYTEEHTFLCPDGQYRIFSWHVRVTPGAGRIFFVPDEITRKCIIGHIGNKLKTVKYST